jgi:kinetochore protein Mis13/DSN1
MKCRIVALGAMPGSQSSSANTKLAYDEDADGFQFSRKTRSAKAQDQPQAVVTTASNNAIAPARTKRKKDSLLGSTPEGEAPAQRRRRSARLSSDKEQSVPPPAQIPAPAQKQKRKRKSNEEHQAETDHEASPPVPAAGLSIAKKRDGTKIALPFADTPVIKRNKEMRREKSKSQHRRSSTGLRGRRASSLIDSGTSNGRKIFRTYSTKSSSRSASKAMKWMSLISEDYYHENIQQVQHANTFWNDVAVPHADVDSRDFYKHIEQSLPEPRRMKQLLTWNGTRALPEKVNGGSGDADEMFAVEGARHMMEELLKDWANKSEMSDWFNREDDVSSAAIVKNPNPHNSRMAEKVQELEAEVKRLQEDKKSWEALRSSNSASTERCPSKAVSEINAAMLDPSQASILTALNSSEPDSITTNAGLTDVSTRLEKINASLEPQIDLFADGIHKLSQYRVAAERVADRILGATATRLERRDREAKVISGTAGAGSREILSALSGALSEQGR